MIKQMYIYDVIGVGFGPANIALAIAMEELSYQGKALFLEARKDATWQENMLFEDSDIQNHPLRDMVTPRNPQSYYSFTNFLHKKGRFFEHLNSNFHLPLRIEYAQYIGWVAGHFDHLVQYKTAVVRIERMDYEEQKVYEITDHQGKTYHARSVVVAPGRTPHIPPIFEGVESKRAIHLNDYLKTLRELPDESLGRIAVVGGSQSAVEIMLHLSERFPQSDVIGIKRCYGYKQKDVNPFTGEVYFPDFVDLFHASDYATKRKLIGDLHYTNYSASDADVLDRLYQKMYQQKIQNREKIFVHRSANVTEVEEMIDGQLMLSVDKLESEEPIREQVGLVILATGFKNIGTRENEEPYPIILDNLAPETELDEQGCLDTNYDYSLTIKGEELRTCFLNGLCESSHGMGDAGSFSLLALRSEIILQSPNTTLQHHKLQRRRRRPATT